MPYKSEKMKLNEKQDRRRRLTDEQKEEIKELYATGLYSSRVLGAKYGVHKSTILIIVNPATAERIKKYSKEHWKDFQASKEDRNIAAKKTRKYKHSLYLKGELK